ncbi:MAG: DNA alkylation repair protein [Alphaproteobacteria bacterium]|nr:DNA alkylation repair protein [Alphaproteobacteria bacterium]
MEPFKNNISVELVGWISRHLSHHLPDFDRADFETPIVRELAQLELKARAQLIADHMHRVLPGDLKVRNQVLQAMLHPVEGTLIGGQSDAQGIRAWGMFPMGMVVGQHGLAEFDGSMALLKQMTSRFSSEFDVRYYLIADPDRALAIMAGWVTDNNPHVRRLVSEGTRPRLPWGMMLHHFVADPAPILPLLLALRDDPEKYGRRSVANNLNDIAKDHPDLVADIARDWLKDASKDRMRLVRHGCRTLIKAGHGKTLAVLGYGPPKLQSMELALNSREIEFGAALEFDLKFRSAIGKAQPLVIDFVIHHQKANGTTSPKVFKWKDTVLGPDMEFSARKKHVFKPITTRVYYSGQHFLEIMVNGTSIAKEAFQLTVSLTPTQPLP